MQQRMAATTTKVLDIHLVEVSKTFELHLAFRKMAVLKSCYS
jgi:hypothetical protein